MTIQEAIKSGKAFKRKIWDDTLGFWWGLVDEIDHVKKILKFKTFDLDIEDILADDWEVRE